jgi:hypothetical protein
MLKIEVAMKTVTIRGIDENLDKMIKTMASKAGMIINQWLMSFTPSLLTPSEKKGSRFPRMTSGSRRLP